MALIRCSQEFHKWVMEKAFNSNNPVSVVLDRVMVKEMEEPGEKSEVRTVEVLEDVCEKLDQLAIKVEKIEDMLEGASVEKEVVEEEEKLEKVKSKLDQVDQDSFTCECGEKVAIEENTKRSAWDSVEWVICPECGSRRKKEDIKR